jgi:hypothetical protein
VTKTVIPVRGRRRQKPVRPLERAFSDRRLPERASVLARSNVSGLGTSQPITAGGRVSEIFPRLREIRPSAPI